MLRSRAERAERATKLHAVCGARAVGCQLPLAKRDGDAMTDECVRLCVPSAPLHATTAARAPSSRVKYTQITPMRCAAVYTGSRRARSEGFLARLLRRPPFRAVPPDRQWLPALREGASDSVVGFLRSAPSRTQHHAVSSQLAWTKAPPAEHAMMPGASPSLTRMFQGPPPRKRGLA